MFTLCDHKVLRSVLNIVIFWQGLNFSFIYTCCFLFWFLILKFLKDKQWGKVLRTSTKKLFWASSSELTRRSILGSDCMTLILMLWLLSECSHSAFWVLPDCLIALWARKMKIDCSRQVWHTRTHRRTLAFLELLSEPKNSYVLYFGLFMCLKR